MGEWKDKATKKFEEVDPNNLPEWAVKAMDAQFDIADLDMTGKLSYDEFKKL
jgi:hypothetical protein